MCWIAAILCKARESGDSTRYVSQREAAKETADVMDDSYIVRLVEICFAACAANCHLHPCKVASNHEPKAFCEYVAMP